MRNLPLYIKRVEARWGHSGYLTAHQCEAFSLVGLQFFFFFYGNKMVATTPNITFLYQNI